MEIEPVDLIKRAVAVVEEASVPQDLRPLAFSRVLDLLANVPGVRRSDVGDGENVKEVDAGRQHSSLVSQIAAKIAVPETLIDRVFDEREGELIFSGNVAALGKNKTEKVQSLALLLLAGRRWAGVDGSGTTSDEILRAEVDSHGLLDVSNYSKQLAPLKPFMTISGSGKRATYKVKYDGLEKAKEIAHSLAGAE